MTRADEFLSIAHKLSDESIKNEPTREMVREMAKALLTMAHEYSITNAMNLKLEETVHRLVKKLEV